LLKFRNTFFGGFYTLVFVAQERGYIVDGKKKSTSPFFAEVDLLA